jgi:sulfite exporter TauE/SafE
MMTLAVDWSMLGSGLFLVVWGLFFSALGFWLSHDDDQLRDMYKKKQMTRIVRRPDDPAKEQEFVRMTRSVARWGFVPSGLVFAALALSLVVRGLLG